MKKMFLVSMHNTNSEIPLDQRMSLVHLSLPDKTLTFTLFDILMLSKTFTTPDIDINEWLSMSESYRLTSLYQQKNVAFRNAFKEKDVYQSTDAMSIQEIPYKKGVSGTPDITHEILLHPTGFQAESEADYAPVRQALTLIADNLRNSFENLNYRVAPENRITMMNGEFYYRHEDDFFPVDDIKDQIQDGLDDFFDPYTDDESFIGYKNAYDMMLLFINNKHRVVDIDNNCHRATKSLLFLSQKNHLSLQEINDVFEQYVTSFSIVRMKKH